MGTGKGLEARRFPESLNRVLGTERFGRVVHWFPVLDSTNDLAVRLAEQGAPEGSLVIAGEQSRGRGRGKRGWYSPAGLGLYFSLILRPEGKARTAPLLTFLAAVALVEVIRERSGLPATIRWPNDILIRGRKAAGILAEARTSTDGVRDLVVGVGWNLRHRAGDFPPDLRVEATSILAEGGLLLSPVRFLAHYLKAWEGWYLRFGREGAAPVLEAWLRLSPESVGAWVKVDDGTRVRVGTTRGVDPEGALLVEDERGMVEPVRFGEVRAVLEVRS